MPGQVPPARTFLESLDSVRGAALEGDADDLVLGLDDLHVFAEALLTLALGRQIVVPQPYAFDSVTFLSLAAHVLAARPRKVAGTKVDRPFGWHAHGAGVHGIDAALAAMIARNPTSENPFHTSAWPQLNSMSLQARLELSADPLKGLLRIDPARAEQLEVAVHEFRQTPRAPVLADNSGGLQLADMVQELRDGAGPTDSDGGLDTRSAEVFERLADAARALVPQDRRLNQRSLLRSNAWPWDPERRPPVEVVGSAVDFNLFVEFVDTAYNRTITESIGDIHGLFSTAIATDDDRQLARGIAQDLALRLRKREAVADRSRSRQQHSLAFEVLDSGRAKESHARELSNLRARAHEALAAIMSARSERGSHRSAPPFWSNVHALNAALASGEMRAVEKALDKHSRLIGSILGSDSREARVVTQAVSGGVFGGAGASIGLALGSGLLVASTVALGAAGAIAPAAPAALRGFVKGHRVASAVRGTLRIVEADRS